MIFLIGCALFIGMSANIEALRAKFKRRRGGDAVKGPPLKKSKGMWRAPALILQALVVDLEAVRVVRVIVR